MERKYGTGIKIVGVLIIASILLWVASLVYSYYRDEYSTPPASGQTVPGP